VSEEPPITISSLDLRRLDQLLDSLPLNSCAEADLLRAELERARVLEPEQMPPDAVTVLQLKGRGGKVRSIGGRPCGRSRFEWMIGVTASCKERFDHERNIQRL
jgi:hypothetical protein